ncbi:MAG: RagB/SusD family nutrient uptake outer membrane protein [Prevotella sp.]|nr:RagB/SusD family nutrient uptake outer membrane protein [Prevotella sp.]
MNSIFNTFKQINRLSLRKAGVGLLCLTMGLSSCDDMLQSDSSRQIFNGELDSKTDSLFFAYGIMQAMQQLADQYVFQGEMRGDNVGTTVYTDNDLRQLYDFSATTSNQYDSAYVYYRVINNCNYYIAHRDTTLLTGSTNVVMHEYAAVKAFRAWAYLQLARNYGSVPFFTEPLTSISQINNNDFPKLDIKGIVNRLAPDMEQYTGYSVPNNGGGNHGVGSTNFGTAKLVNPALCYIPVDVILGELYLESGDYANAARHYTTYVTSVSKIVGSSYAEGLVAPYTTRTIQEALATPNDMLSTSNGQSWKNIFAVNGTQDIISYIPMAVNSMRGTTTSVPLTFGYNYYSTVSSTDELYVDEIQLEPSQALKSLSDSTTYYYYRDVSGGLPQQYVGSAQVGDMRLKNITRQGTDEDSTKLWIQKYNNGNIILFRNTTVYLHLAEALNRLGYPDAAFAILKEGITEQLLDSTRTYVSAETKQLLQTTYPFLSTANKSMFPAQTTSNYNTTNWGIHQHGAGVTGDGNYPGRSGYQFDAVVSKKMEEISKQFNLTVGATAQDTLNAKINAVEDLLCDEYQLEFAFEGTRWYDLMRLARHKNEAGTFGADFGGRWLAEKLKFKNLSVDLKNQDKWYLPFE